MNYRRAMKNVGNVFSSIVKFPDKVFNFFKTNRFFVKLNSLNDKANNKKSNSKLRNFMNNVCRKITKLIEKNIVYRGIVKFERILLTCKLSIYGTFLLAFAASSALATALKTPIIYEKYDMMSFYVSVILAIMSLPLLSSKQSLASSLNNSLFGKSLRELMIINFDENELEKRTGHIGITIIIAVVLGGLSFLLTPIVLIKYMVMILVSLIIMSVPEIGIIISIIFALFSSLINSAIIIAMVSFALFIKAIRGKRVFVFERTERIFYAFVFVTILTLAFDGYSDGISTVFKYLFLIFIFFVISVVKNKFCINSCYTSLVVASFLVSIYVIIGKAISLVEIDFIRSSSIILKVVETIKDHFVDCKSLIPVLVVLFPIVNGRLHSGKIDGSFSFLSLLATFTSFVAIFSEWNPLYFYLVILSIVFLRLVKKPRFLYGFLLIAIGLPVIYFVEKNWIIDFVNNSLSNIYSVTYDMDRPGVISATFDLIKDFFLVGTGFDESRWKYIYSMYSTPGTIIPSDCGNLYLQILSIFGIFGFMLFIFGLFFVLLAVFSNFVKLSHNRNNENIYLDGLFIDNPEKDILAKYNIRKYYLATPFCSLVTLLILGFFENVWGDFRMLFVFWLVLGLVVAVCKCNNAQLSAIEGLMESNANWANEADIDLKYRARIRK